jgi:uncharacterized SAM-dependent methyltransferase
MLKIPLIPEGTFTRMFHAKADADRAIDDALKKSLYDDIFLKDMQDFFSKKRSGHVLRHVFSGPAFSLWEEFTRAAGSYYPFASDVEIIRDHAALYREVANTGGKHKKPLIAIELGPGSAHAIENKTLPLLRAIKPDTYAAVDLSMECLLMAGMMVQSAMPDIKTYTRLKDFNKDIIDYQQSMIRDTLQKVRLPAGGKRFMFQFGSTICNIEGHLEEPLPVEQIKASLKNYRRHLRQGDVMIIGMDQNQDLESLNACYGSPLIKNFAFEMLRRVEKELPVSKGYDVNNFEFVRVWRAENALYGVGFKVKKGMQFTLGGQLHNLVEGDVLLFANTHKLNQDFYERLYPEVDFRLQHTLSDKDNRMHQHILQAL